MNTKTNFFETKEQYLNFRKAFASAVNDPRSRKGKPQPPHGYRQKGWMTAAHYMLLNAVRGLPVTRGFMPYTKSLVLQNGILPDHNIDYSRRVLENAIAAAKDYVEAKPADTSNSWRYGKVTQEQANKKKQDGLAAGCNAFLEPFNGALSIADLARLNINNIVEMVEADVVEITAPVQQQPTTQELEKKKGLLSRLFS